MVARLLLVLGFMLAGLQVGFAPVAQAQPACTSTAPNAIACQSQATSLQGTDVILGQQATGPLRSNQTVQMSINQVVGGGFPGVFSSLRDTGITGSTQCLQANSSGTISGTGSSCGGSGGVTWPATGDLVISNSTSSPAGLVPVNGDCVVGSGGAWTAGSCGSGGGITGPGTTVNNFVPQWSGTTGSALSAGLPVGLTGNSTIVETTSGGVLTASLLPNATSSAFGAVKPDNATITISAGVISAVGGSATSITPGTTTIGGATAPCYIENSTGTTMACTAVTGTGNVVLATSPTITTPTISGNLTTNVTGSTQCVQANTSGVLSGTGAACVASGSSGIDIQSFTANGTWTAPTACSTQICFMRIRLIGGGGSGGGGAMETFGTVGSGGAAGGGGACIDIYAQSTQFTSPVTVTVATSVTGGTGASVAGPGGNGTVGNDTSFGTYFKAYAGGGAAGGQTAAASGGGASAGFNGDGASSTGSTGGIASAAAGTTAGGSGATAAANPGGMQNTGGSGASTSNNAQGTGTNCVSGSGTGGTLLAGSAVAGASGAATIGVNIATGGASASSGTAGTGGNAVGNGALFPATSGEAGGGGNTGGAGGNAGAPGANAYGCGGAGGGAGTTAGGNGGNGCPGYAVVVTTIGPSL